MKRVAIYARVSTTDQDTRMQIEDLERYATAKGWAVVGKFVDEGISGSVASRPALDELMDRARKRLLDVVLIWRFDRFARSSQHLLAALEEFRLQGIEFVSYQENIDTATPLGQAMFTIVAAMAQLERDIIRERVRAGVKRAQSLGTRFGRPEAVFDINAAVALKAAGHGLREIAQRVGTSPATLSRALRAFQKPPAKTAPASL